MAVHDQYLPQGFLLENYRIERVLGAGGFGVTYLAHDIDLDSTVAIKEFFPSHNAIRADSATVVPRTGESQGDFDEHRDRFLAEARTLARFSDVPGIVSVRRLFKALGTAYIVMAYIEGESLSARIKRLGAGPADKVLPIVRRLAEGLEKVHAAGFLHRDIKPGNILLDMNDQPVLIDFGAARLSMGAETQALSVILTPGYAPIEQYSERARQGPWTDIYGLAAVAFFAVTGKRPVDAISVSQGEEQIALVPRDGSAAETTLFEAIRWGMKPAAADRPQTVGAWRKALEELKPTATATGRMKAAASPARPVRSAPPPPPPPPPAPPRDPEATVPAHLMATPTAPPGDPSPVRGKRNPMVYLGGVAAAIAAVAIVPNIAMTRHPSVDSGINATAGTDGTGNSLDGDAGPNSDLDPFHGTWKLVSDTASCATVPKDQLIPIAVSSRSIVIGSKGAPQTVGMPDAEGWYQIQGLDWRVSNDRLQMRSGKDISEFVRCG